MKRSSWIGLAVSVVIGTGAGALLASGLLTAPGAFESPVVANPPQETEASALAHNYTHIGDGRFVDEKIVEVNGWLLLEAVLSRALDRELPAPLDRAIASFGSDDGLYGIWPEQDMASGRVYLEGRDPLVVAYDLNDTAWGYRLRGEVVPPEVLAHFVSSQPLDPFAEASCTPPCAPEKVLRLWARSDWHDEIDIVAIANVISMLPADSDWHEPNAALVNEALESGNRDRYLRYYRPPVLGDLLLLIYDNLGASFLSAAARQRLQERVSGEWKSLRDYSLSAPWEDDEALEPGDPSITMVNTNIPALLADLGVRRGVLAEAEPVPAVPTPESSE